MLADGACTAYTERMQYTIRRIPKALDRALRERAARENKSMNEVAVEAMAQGLGVGGARIKHRELHDLAGRWVNDEAIDEALSDQRRIDDAMWR